MCEPFWTEYIFCIAASIACLLFSEPSDNITFKVKASSTCLHLKGDIVRQVAFFVAPYQETVRVIPTLTAAVPP